MSWEKDEALGETPSHLKPSTHLRLSISNFFFYYFSYFPLSTED